MENIFGQAAKARRLRLGISKNEVARRSKLSANEIADMERGEPTLSLDKIVKICDALNLSAEEMFKIEPVAKRKKRKANKKPKPAL
jgi:transcriptional regulator with XRE-family HTH domain